MYNIKDSLKVGKSYTIWQEVHDKFMGVYVQVAEMKEGEASVYYNASSSNKIFTVKEGYDYIVQIQTHTTEKVGTLTNFQNRYMIYEGTEDKTYEPYGAMPSPAYPAKKRNVGDNVNIFDINNRNKVFSTANDSLIKNGIRVINEIAGNARACVYKILDVTKFKGQSFTVKAKWKSSSENTGRIILGLCNEDGTIRKSGTPEDISDKPLTYIVPNDLGETKYLAMWLYSNYNGTANVGDYVDYTDIKVEQGTQATPYTPFGYGSADFKVQNKNVLKGLSTPKTYTDYWHIADTDFTPLENGWGKFSHDSTNETSNVYTRAIVKSNAVNLKPNTQYTFVIEIRNSKVSEDNTITFKASQATDNSCWKENAYLNYNEINSGGIFKRLITTKENLTDKNIGVNTNLQLKAGTKGTVEARISIIEGDYDISNFKYTPCEEQTAHFPLAKPLHKGDYLADDGIHYKRKTIIFDGTEAWFKSSTALVNRFGLTTSKVNNFKGINSDNTLCTHFKYDERNRITINAYHFLNSNALYFDTDMENVTTLEEWKSYLAEQYANGTPVILEYGLVEEIVEEYTEEQQEAYNKLKELYSYEDVTHITCENDIACNFNVEHFKDYNILRQNDKQELQAQIDEIKASLTSEVSE